MEFTSADDKDVEDASKSKAVTPSTTWEPLTNVQHRNPTAECLRRIRKDVKSLFRDPLPGIYVVPDDTNATLLHAIIVGPFGTPYEGGFFYFILDCPDDYPYSPPKVKLMTTGGGRVRFNPNLYANGKVCLSILGTWSGPGWSIVQTIASVLMSIQSLMNETPYHNEPGFETADAMHVEAYNHCIRHETIRVAVLEMIGDTSMAKSIPTSLREVIDSLYPSFLDSYIITCCDNIAKDGHPIIDPFGGSRGHYCYATMLEILESLMTACDTDLKIAHVEEESEVDFNALKIEVSDSNSSFEKDNSYSSHVP